MLTLTNAYGAAPKLREIRMQRLTETYVREQADLKIYRFISFFDLYEILVNRRLRFSKLSTFSDKNEGIGHILEFQDHYLFRHMHIDPVRIEQEHSRVQENNYLSCWTTEADLISMWALYSPDCASIRISTSVGKLWSVLGSLYSRMLWTKENNNPGSRAQIIWHSQLEPVEYVDFFKIRDEIRKKYQAFEQMASAAMRADKSYSERPDGFKKDYDELHSKKIVTRDGLFLKDQAYIHENEVRAVVSSGVRNDLTLEEFRKLDDPFASFFEGAKTGELPNYIYADVDSNFIDAVCFDPRLPEFKRHVFESILSGVLPTVEKSRAFGYAPRQESFASDYDGNPIE